MDWIMKNRWHNYTTLSKEEKREYHREYEKKYREEKTRYYLSIKRWLLWRYVDEKKCFNKEDYLYLKQLYNENNE